MDRWTQIELFVQTIELGSLTKAADKLGLSNPAASRHLAALEERLGTRLLERTTRRQWLTEGGREFHQRCAIILAEMAEAELAANESTEKPSGQLRITSSVSFAMMHIAPALAEFKRAYPAIDVDIITSNRYLEFIEAGVDIAIRTREYEPDSNVTVRRLAETRRVLAASPGYFAQHGKPQTLAELDTHQFLVYNLAKDPLKLRFKRGKEISNVNIKATLEANEGQIIRAAGVAGHGILIQPLYIIYDDIVAGRLVPILMDWDLPRLIINIAYQSKRHQPAKIRVFIDFLVERFKKLNLERKWTSSPELFSTEQELAPMHGK